LAAPTFSTRQAQYRSVRSAKPRLAEKSPALKPLLRQASTRFFHSTALAMHDRMQLADQASMTWAMDRIRV